MAKFKVVVPLLNKRTAPVENTDDTRNVVGKVNDQFEFESVEEETNSLGTWYKDRDGNWYWGGGVEVASKNFFPGIATAAEKANMGWGLKKLLIPIFWEAAENKGENIKIAILDTGISSAHPEFDYTKISRFNVLNGDNIAEDTNGHGTHVAGIIAAQGKQVTGVAPMANLFVIKIAEDNDSWQVENVVKGIQHAIDKKVDIISISGEFPKRNPDLESLKQKILDAINLGIIIIASAGNNFNDFPVESFPAAFDECISVGSIKEDGTRADSSTHSTKLDVVAPGENIKSTWLNDGYREESGTSMATPFVAGVVAAIKSFTQSRLKRNISPSEIQIILNKTADDAGDKGFDISYGFGIINPVAAMKTLTP